VALAKKASVSALRNHRASLRLPCDDGEGGFVKLCSPLGISIWAGEHKSLVCYCPCDTKAAEFLSELSATSVLTQPQML
jgi:hypothetical protein